jgi:hypothetical protein
MRLHEAYSKVRKNTRLPDMFSTQNVLKEGDALPLLLFNYDLEYAIRTIKCNQAGFLTEWDTSASGQR